MRSGRLIVPATRRTVGKTQSFALYSDDNGAEWRAGEVVEAHLHELHRLRKQSEPDAIDDDVPEEFRPYLGKYLLVAANAEFEINYRRGSLRMHDPLERMTRASLRMRRISRYASSPLICGMVMSSNTTAISSARRRNNSTP